MMVKRYSSYTDRVFFCVPYNHSIVLWCDSSQWHIAGSHAAYCSGGHHTLAPKSDGTVWAWGYNGYGELGDGTYTDSSTPVQVYGMSGATAIAAGIITRYPEVRRDGLGVGI